MTEPVSKQDQTDIRDRLFKELADIGNEKGFNDIELTQTTTLQSGERMEWSIRVVFKRGTAR